MPTKTETRISTVRIDGTLEFYPAGLTTELMGPWFGGIAARFAGEDVDSNPYQGKGLTESRKRRAWSVGWNDADNRLRPSMGDVF